MSNLTNVVSTPSLHIPLHADPQKTQWVEAAQEALQGPHGLFVLGCIVGGAWLAAVVWSRCQPRLCPTSFQYSAYLRALNGRVEKNQSYLEATRAAENNRYPADRSVRFWALSLFTTLVDKGHVPAYDPALTAALQEPPHTSHRNAASGLLRALVIKKHEPSYEHAFALAQATKNNRDGSQDTAYFIVRALVENRYEPAYQLGLELAVANRNSSDDLLRWTAYLIISKLVSQYAYPPSYEPAIAFVQQTGTDMIETSLGICETLMNRGYDLIYPSACTIATQLLDQENAEHRRQAGRFLSDLALQGYAPSYAPARTAVERLRESPHIKDRTLANDLVRVLTLRGQNGRLAIEDRATDEGVGVAGDAALPAAPPAQRATNRALKQQEDLLRALGKQVKQGQSYPAATLAAQEGIKSADPYVRFWALHLFIELVRKQHLPAYELARAAALQEMVCLDSFNRQAAGRVFEALIDQWHWLAYESALTFAQQEENSPTPKLAKTSDRIAKALADCEYAPIYPHVLSLATQKMTSLEPKDHQVALQFLRDLVLRGYTESYTPAFAAAQRAFASPDAEVRTLARRVITLLDLQGRAALSSAPSAAPTTRQRRERKAAETEEVA